MIIFSILSLPLLKVMCMEKKSYIKNLKNSKLKNNNYININDIAKRLGITKSIQDTKQAYDNTSVDKNKRKSLINILVDSDSVIEYKKYCESKRREEMYKHSKRMRDAARSRNIFLCRAQQNSLSNKSIESGTKDSMILPNIANIEKKKRDNMKKIYVNDIEIDTKLSNVADAKENIIRTRNAYKIKEEEKKSNKSRGYLDGKERARLMRINSNYDSRAYSHKDATFLAFISDGNTELKNSLINAKDKRENKERHSRSSSKDYISHYHDGCADIYKSRNKYINDSSQEYNNSLRKYIY